MRQWQHFFQHAGHVAQLVPARHQLVPGLDADLALAVVAHACGLEDAGQQRVVDGRQLLGGLDHGVGGAWHAALHEVGLLSRAVLGDRHGRAGGRYGQALGQLV